MNLLHQLTLQRARERGWILRWNYDNDLRVVTIDVDANHTLVFNLDQLDAFCHGTLVASEAEVPA